GAHAHDHADGHEAAPRPALALAPRALIRRGGAPFSPLAGLPRRRFPLSWIAFARVACTGQPTPPAARRPPSPSRARSPRPAAAGASVIARPGPAYKSESSASNLPGWLLAQGGNLRANGGRAYCGADAYSPVYAAAYTDWYRHVLPIIAARQITTGRGTVIALQIENAYAPRCGDTRYMRELHDLAREMGIDVPLLANNNTCCTAAGSWHVAGDDGQPIVDIPAEDDYPCSGICPTNWDNRVFHTVDGLEWRL